MVGSIMLIYIWEFRSYGSGGELCCRNSPLSPPRCLARGSDPLGASSPWDLAPESLSPTGQGLGTAAAPVMSATDPRLRERHRRCPQCCGSLKCRPKPRPPAFPQQQVIHLSGQEGHMFLRLLMFHVSITKECSRNNKRGDVRVKSHSNGPDGMVTSNGG
jgi:hypothetical protein